MTIRHLRLISIFYFMLPNLLFFYFWTNPLVSILNTGICLISFYFEIKDHAFQKELVFKSSDLVKIVLCSFILCLLSGTCGIFYQTSDHWAHNTKFFELFKNDWPIRIPGTGPAIGYYYGYYVVPALISKALGYLSSGAILFWTTLGISIGICWLYVCVGQKIWYVLLVLTVGDFAHVSNSLFTKLFQYPYAFSNFGIGVWSNFENLFWVPNQFIPSIIIGGMLAYCVKGDIAPERMAFPVALSFWWAVFPSFTMSILVAVLILKKWLDGSLPTFSYKSGITIIFSCIIVVPILLLFISHERPAVAGFIWDFNDQSDSRLLEYALNVGVNVIALAILYWYFSAKNQPEMSDFAFYVVLLMLLVLPIIRIGKVNDFLFRGLMPLLVVAGVFIYQYSPFVKLYSSISSSKRLFFNLLLYFLIIGPSFLAIGRISRALVINRFTASVFPDRVNFEPVPYNVYSNVYEVLQARWSQAEADQYLGKRNSIYERLIAPK